MKKIPTLFTRIFEDRRIVGIRDEIAPGCQEAFYNGIATIKVDGSCCAVIDGKFYKRYDAKKGKKPPVGAIPCCDPDPETGHWPHWVQIDHSNPSDKWFVKAKDVYEATINNSLPDGTYEAIGKHFNGNPYNLIDDRLVKHGTMEVDVERDFESVSNWLNEHKHEGLVFWLNGEPVCKIKRTDFGYSWPIKGWSESIELLNPYEAIKGMNIINRDDCTPLTREGLDTFINREWLANRICEATQKTSYKCNNTCKELCDCEGGCSYCLTIADHILQSGIA